LVLLRDLISLIVLLLIQQEILFVTEIGNHLIRKIASNGNVTTFAGTSGAPGSTDGIDSVAKFSEPRGIKIDSYGNLFVADTFNHLIRKITPNGFVTNFAGKAGISGSNDDTATAATFSPSFRS
jgi:hypothetical protein